MKSSYPSFPKPTGPNGWVERTLVKAARGPAPWQCRDLGLPYFWPALSLPGGLRHWGMHQTFLLSLFSQRVLACLRAARSTRGNKFLSVTKKKNVYGKITEAQPLRALCPPGESQRPTCCLSSQTFPWSHPDSQAWSRIEGNPPRPAKQSEGCAGVSLEDPHQSPLPLHLGFQ